MIESVAIMSISDYYEYERKLKAYENRRNELLEEYAKFPEKRVSITFELGGLRIAKSILERKRMREERK